MKSFIFASLACCLLLASPSSAGITAAVDRETIVIGDTVLLNIRAHSTETTAFSIPKVWNLAPFELRSSSCESSAHSLDLRLELQIFDTGSQFIPPIVIACETLDSSTTVSTETVTVQILDVLIPGDTGLREIIGIREDPDDAAGAKRNWFYYALGALIAIGLIIWWLRQKRGGSIFAPARPLDPYEEFLRQMDLVDRMLDRGGIPAKDIYSVITEAVKRVIVAKEGVDTTGLTTAETLAHTGVRCWERDHFDELRSLLETADLVKFAKMKPLPVEIRANLDRISNVVATRYGKKNSDRSTGAGNIL